VHAENRQHINADNIANTTLLILCVWIFSVFCRHFDCYSTTRVEIANDSAPNWIEQFYEVIENNICEVFVETPFIAERPQV
jgi:hypothetical protein